MSRNITTAFENEIKADKLRPALFVKAEFDGGDINLWSGIGIKNFNGDDYSGAGEFLQISNITESQKLQANGLNFTLSGLPISLISLALAEDNENYSWKPITLWIAVMDENLQIIADPYIIFSGRMDVMEISEEGSTSVITVAAENNLIDLKEPRERRYTHEDQIAEFAGDLGLKFMPTNSDTSIQWGGG